MLVAIWISSMAKLNTVNFLLSKVLEWGALALVILFQPEIRRFLEQVGRSSLGKVFTHVEDVNEIENA